MPAASRRHFLKTAALAAAPFLLRWDLRAAAPVTRKTLRFGLCADPHKDLMHDADERLRVFIDEMKATRPDFILQLGDFCRPYEKNRGFLNIWEEFPGARYHVLGNHDADGGFTWPQVMKFWGMENPHYSFDRDGWHFVVLNGNEKNPAGSRGYPRHIGETQLAWLAADIRATALPVILFCHQSLESDEESIDNREEVRAVLEKENAASGWNKVGLCFSGHHHIDHLRTLNGIAYVQINSMSYYYMEGVTNRRPRVSAEIDKAHGIYANAALYRDPLYATVTLSPSGEVSLAGKTSAYLGGSPEELGFKHRPGTDADKERTVARISSRKLKVAVR